MAEEPDILMLEQRHPHPHPNPDDQQPQTSAEDAEHDKDRDDKNDIHKSDRKIGHRRVGVGGEITYKKIQTTQIMGSIQLGIQHAVGGLASKPERDLLMQDFMTVETTNFPHEGSNHTPAHHYSEFRFKTYAPIAFRYFRDLFGIQPDDFLMSMCSSPLRELSNPGASGSIFYLTDDDEFIIKTVQHKEGEFLQKLLPGYYMNLNQNPRTLLPKFFGLYCYQCNSKNVRLVAMNNLLPSVVKLHQKYDLKGSTYKRKASKSERSKKSPTYKDLDFMEHHPMGLFLEADTHGALVKTIQRDCRVLESFKIMDYSLLVGVHNLDKAQREKNEERIANASGEGKTDDEGAVGERSALTRTRSINRQRLVAHSTAMESIQAESEPIDEEEDVPSGGIPARNAQGERLLLFIGVIDILQSYRFRKKLEHTWKSMIHDGDTVSVHRPSFYAQRFQDFMAKKVFMKITSPLKHSPSKRKSISRPLKPQEELETSGPSTSYLQQEAVQFPRVLWANPSKPKTFDATEDFRLYTVPEIPFEIDDSSVDNSRRFSMSTDSYDSRIPSPLGTYSDTSSVNRWMTRSPQNINNDKHLNPTNRGSLPAFHIHAGYRGMRSTKSTPRKISFAPENKVENDLPIYKKSLSTASSHNSIPESLKDVPFIDNIDDSAINTNEKYETDNDKESNPIFVTVNREMLEVDKKEIPLDDTISRKSTDSGFFSSIKKSVTNFFLGRSSKNDVSNIDEKKNNTIDPLKNNKIEAKNCQNNDDSMQKNPEDQKSNHLTLNNLEMKKTDNFYEECASEDIAILPYKENCIDIVKEIEICTDFAETDILGPDLEISWNNKKIKSAYSTNRTISNEIYKPIQIT